MLIVSVITVAVSILIAFAVVFKNYRSLSNLTFFMSLLSSSAVIFADTMSVLQPDYMNEWQRFVMISEAVMAPSWLLFSLSFARDFRWRDIGFFYRLLLYFSPLIMIFFMVVPIENIFYAPKFSVEGILFLEDAGFVASLLLLLYPIVSIICLEATLRSSSGSKRWRIKYTLIGVGGIIAMNIFYYSHALLYRSINMNLLPVRTGVFLIAILFIGITIFRQKVMDVKVIVSREVLYKSISLFVVGFYLLGLGVIGEGMRYFGPEAGTNITTFLGFAGAILLVTMIMSEQIRRKVVVFIDKNFYKHKYDYRSQWLQFTQRISLKHSFEELLYAIIEGFKETMGVTGAEIWLKEKESEEFVCLKTLDFSETRVKPGKEILDFLGKTQWVLNVNDDTCKKIVTNNKEYFEKNMISVMVPLLNVDELLGFIVLGEDLAGNEYNYEDYDLLKTFARQATAAILNAKLSEELIDAKEMEAMGRLSSFITHDLKNAASMLSLIAQNAEEHIDNPEFQKDAIRAVANTSEKIKGIIGKLRNLPRKTRLNMKYSDLGMCVKNIVRELNLEGQDRLSFKELQSVETAFDNEEIGKVILNLIMNALDAIDENGKIEISIGRKNSMSFVSVSDNGCGISKDFIERSLFRPFQTTKKKGLGIGLYQCKTIVEAHSGQLKVKSEEGNGTEFIVYLPVTSG